MPEYVSDGGEYVRPYQGIFSFNTKDLTDLYQGKNDPLILTHLAIFSDGINNFSKAYHWSLRAFDLARKNGDQQVFLMISSVCSQYSLINFKIEEAFESYLLFSAISSHLEGSPKEKQEILSKINLSDIFSSKPSVKWNSAEDTTISFAIIPLFILVLTSHLENTENKIEYTEAFKNMLRDYILKASDKVQWEVVLELCTRIIENNISERELIDRGNTFGNQERKNLQIICVLGIIYTVNDSNMQLTQIINIFPYFTNIFGSTKSIIKFILVPFVKNMALNIIKDYFVGSMEEYMELVKNTEMVSVSDQNAIQLILQPLINEFDINIMVLP